MEAKYIILTKGLDGDFSDDVLPVFTISDLLATPPDSEPIINQSEDTTVRNLNVGQTYRLDASGACGIYDLMRIF